jgi:hypothetical protein
VGVGALCHTVDSILFARTELPRRKEIHRNGRGDEAGPDEVAGGYVVAFVIVLRTSLANAWEISLYGGSKGN